MHKTIASTLLKDWRTYPKFRHNLWTTYDDKPEVTYLTVSHATFEVPRSDAETFLCLRTYCTGHHTIPEIAQKSGVDEATTQALLTALMEAEVGRPAYRPLHTLRAEEIRQSIFVACRMWSVQLAETYIAADIKAGKVSKSVLLGWLLETYHYIRAFPKALAYAAGQAQGELRAILTEYADQEDGHERFLLRCLTNVGFKPEEVTESIPLVSTRLIDLLMRNLFGAAPAAALLVAMVLEAGDLDERDGAAFRDAIAAHYDIAAEALGPFQEHMLLDAHLGHSTLAERYAHLIVFEDERQIHDVVNQIHDLKHAFDLQSLEIKAYYSHTGNYVPRQFVDFFAI